MFSLTDLQPLIEAAFEHVRHPGWDIALYGHPLWEGYFSPDDWEIEKMISMIPETMSWKDVPEEVFDIFSGHMLLTTPPAFQFFLAAHLWAAATAREENTEVILHICLTLREHGSGKDCKVCARFESLSDGQRSVLREFVKRIAADDLYGRLHPELATIWDVDC